MSFSDKKQQIIQMALHLIKIGLIARTWGNISIRVDSETMLITPSGRRYETMVPDDIVLMDINSMSYTGKHKPSEEKRIHAAAYRMDNETGAVIHTHQPVASAVAAARQSIPVNNPDWKMILGGNEVKCGKYALPGTKKLTKVTMAALKGHKSCLLANHGVICTGKDIDDAVKVALTLESAAQAFIENSFRKKTDKVFSVERMHEYYLDVS